MNGINTFSKLATSSLSTARIRKILGMMSTGFNPNVKAALKLKLI